VTLYQLTENKLLATLRSDTAKKMNTTEKEVVLQTLSKLVAKGYLVPNTEVYDVFNASLLTPIILQFLSSPNSYKGMYGIKLSDICFQVRSGKRFKSIKTKQILNCLEILELESSIYRTGENEWKYSFL